MGWAHSRYNKSLITWVAEMPIGIAVAIAIGTGISKEYVHTVGIAIAIGVTGIVVSNIRSAAYLWVLRLCFLLLITAYFVLLKTCFW